MVRKLLPYVVVGGVAAYHTIRGFGDGGLFDLCFGFFLVGILAMMLVIDLYLIPKLNRQASEMHELWRYHPDDKVFIATDPAQKENHAAN